MQQTFPCSWRWSPFSDKLWSITHRKRLFSRITTMFFDFQTLANHEKFIFMLCYPDRELLTIVGKCIYNCFVFKYETRLSGLTLMYYSWIYVYLYIYIYIDIYTYTQVYYPYIYSCIYTYREALLCIYASVISVIVGLDKRLLAWTASSHWLNQRWLIVNWACANSPHWHLY